MTEKSVTRNLVRSLAALLTTSVIPLCRIGPLDSLRTSYNFIYGDMPVLKQELFNYCKEGIQRDNFGLTGEQLDDVLRTELRYVFQGSIDPNKVSIEELWDTQENHAKSSDDRWFWANLR